jgi:hypothetical protein
MRFPRGSQLLSSNSKSQKAASGVYKKGSASETEDGERVNEISLKSVGVPKTFKAKDVLGEATLDTKTTTGGEAGMLTSGS